MTWIKFAFWLSGIYLFYYLLIILWDVLRGSNNAENDHSEEFIFDDHTPALVTVTDDHPGTIDSVVSSGGVSLKDLFTLAREEVVEFTRAVTFR